MNRGVLRAGAVDTKWTLWPLQSGREASRSSDIRRRVAPRFQPEFGHNRRSQGVWSSPCRDSSRPHLEQSRFRGSGVRIPSAPPSTLVNGHVRVLSRGAGHGHWPFIGHIFAALLVPVWAVRGVHGATGPADGEEIRKFRRWLQPEGRGGHRGAVAALPVRCPGRQTRAVTGRRVRGLRRRWPGAGQSPAGRPSACAARARPGPRSRGRSQGTSCTRPSRLRRGW
jgi:hypothetical protein